MEKSSDNNKEEVRRGTYVSIGVKKKRKILLPNSWLKSVDPMKILTKVLDESLK
jgi:hypothetical protein